MNNYFFLTSPRVGPDLNAGSHLISDGVKALIHFADPKAVLQDITLFNYRPIDWKIILSQAKGIFLCGNPRFAPGEHPYFWCTELLEHMKKAQATKIKIGDLFLGSAFPIPTLHTSAMATELLKSERNKKTQATLSTFDLVITRDPLSQKICSQLFDHSILLPDSTFWAKDFYHVQPGKKKHNCVTAPSLNCTPWLLKKLHEISKRLAKEKTTYFLCHAKNEYWLTRKTIPDIKNLIIIYDPDALLRFYADTDKLVSCRLHGSIPALSLGVNVINIAVDSRAFAYDQFGFRSVPYIDLKDKDIPLKFDHIDKNTRPSAQPFVEIFKHKIIR